MSTERKDQSYGNPRARGKEPASGMHDQVPKQLKSNAPSMSSNSSILDPNILSPMQINSASFGKTSSTKEDIAHEHTNQRKQSYYANMSPAKKAERVQKAKERRQEKRKLSFDSASNTSTDEGTSSFTPFIPTTNSPNLLTTLSSQPRITRPRRPRLPHQTIRMPPQFSSMLPSPTLCTFCTAKKFFHESNAFCCSNGEVKLQVHKPPTALHQLFSGSNNDSCHFHKYVRAYNNMFAFTSLGVKVDRKINMKNKGIYTFKVQGQMYHYVNDLTPTNDAPRYLQLYFYDTDHEIENRLQNSNQLRSEIITSLMDILNVNPYATFFRMLKDINVNEQNHIVIYCDPSADQRTFNAPTTSQVAAIWIEDEGTSTTTTRNIIVHSNSGCSHRIMHYYGCYDPLQYPLLFPFGQSGWHQGIKRFRCNTSSSRPSSHKESDKFSTAQNPENLIEREEQGISKRQRGDGVISCCEYYSYIFQMRPQETSCLLRAGRLLQQYMVDMYIKIESTRLDYFRTNQEVIRADLYQGLLDAATSGETQASTCGKRIVLPTSFIGGPRDMKKRFLDAMALVQRYGKPDIFLTLTCNPSWPEIQQELATSEKAYNRPDLLTRIFHAKLMEVKAEIVTKGVFGPVAAFVYVVEFQKRGLPHAHFLVILKRGHKIKSPEDFDKYVSAEIPNREDNIHLYEAVVSHMMHGPCGARKPNNVCMNTKGQCKNRYPREFCEYSMTSNDSYPIYRRRNNGRTAYVRKETLDNRWVVPYNAYLLAKFNCHINVEICSSIKAVKYLYKYVYKGHDRVHFQVSALHNNPSIDEISQFQAARWISPPEAAWRIFKFHLNDISPSVLSLQLHLPDMQSVGFRATEKIQNVIRNDKNSRTMLTEFFRINRESKSEEKYLYSEFPEHYVWNTKYHLWFPRQRGFMVGRIVAANPIEGERYYLRLLLLHVRGPTSFYALKTVNGKLFPSFRDAAEAHGLLESDNATQKCLQEAATFQMPVALRRLFATLLVFCESNNPRALWDTFYDSLSEDFRRNQNLKDVDILHQTIRSVGHFLESMGRNVSEYNLPSIDTREPELTTKYKDIEEQLHIDIPYEDLMSVSQLNTCQRNAYNIIWQHVQEDAAGAFFVDGPGGTGKTYLYRTLLATARSKGFIALATASSGIAASNLPGGRTSHSRFRLPLADNNSSFCNISKQSSLANLIRATRLFIWDEASMARKQTVEAFEAMLRDICSNDTAFGAKVVVFGGDFRQVLPVTPRASRHEAISNSLAMSDLWDSIEKLYLTENMRAIDDPEFSKFLLRIGNGTEQCTNEDSIEIPKGMVIPYTGDSKSISDLTDFIYPSMEQHLSDTTYFTNRAILTPKNEYVDEINSKLIQNFPGDAYTYTSFDKAIDDTHQNYQPEFLHTLSPNGMPRHQLLLNQNSPVMLLRNLDPFSGLCNGTRLICKSFERNIVVAEIASGQYKGNRVFIPRIPLRPPTSEKYPFQFERKQFPLRLSFGMTINKAQGQTLEKVGIYLPEPVFSHGQLYVALSRAQKGSDVKVVIKPRDEVPSIYQTRNVVYKELLARTKQSTATEIHLPMVY